MLFLPIILTSICTAALTNGMPHFGPPPPPPFGPPPHHGGPPMPFPPPGPPPEYLLDVSEKAEKEHMHLLMDNEGMSKSELRNSLDKWADSNGVKAEYEKFMGEHDQRRKDYHDLVAANLAGDALAAFDKIWEITEDAQISRLAECEKVRSVLGELKIKIRALVPVLPPMIPGPPPPGCFPPPPPGFGPARPPSDGAGTGSFGDGMTAQAPRRAAQKEPKRMKITNQNE